MGEQVVREDGTPATVVTIAVRPGAADYYNLTVSVLHTYAVGAGQYVVHNCSPLDGWREHAPHFAEQWAKRGKPSISQMDNILQNGTPLKDLRSDNYGLAGKIGKKWYTLWYDATDNNKLVSIVNEADGGYRPFHPKLGNDWISPSSLEPRWSNPFASY